MLGFLPGVLLKPSTEDLKEIEVDLLVVKAGRVIIGECKASGRLDEKEVQRLAELANRLECSRIVYATPANFNQNREIIESARGLSTTSKLEVWERDQLLDRGGVYFNEEASAEGYLQRLADVLA